MDAWRGAFRRQMQEAKPGDIWSLRSDKRLDVRKLEPGWKAALQERARASFKCSQCSRTWSSHQVAILFHMFWERSLRQGQVLMRRFRQECRCCSSPQKEKPQFSREEMESVVRHLILNIRVKCYGERVQRDELLEVVCEGGGKPHKSESCEACQMGIHKGHDGKPDGAVHYGEADGALHHGKPGGALYCGSSLASPIDASWRRSLIQPASLSAAPPSSCPGKSGNSLHHGKVDGALRHGEPGGALHHGMVDGALHPGKVHGTLHHGEPGGALHHGKVDGALHHGEPGGALHHGKVDGALHHGKVDGALHHGKVDGALHHGKVDGALHHEEFGGALFCGSSQRPEYSRTPNLQNYEASPIDTSWRIRISLIQLPGPPATSTLSCPGESDSALPHGKVDGALHHGEPDSAFYCGSFPASPIETSRWGTPMLLPSPPAEATPSHPSCTCCDHCTRVIGGCICRVCCGTASCIWCACCIIAGCIWCVCCIIARCLCPVFSIIHNCLVHGCSSKVIAAFVILLLLGYWTGWF